MSQNSDVVADNQWNIPRLRERLEEIIPQNSSFSDFEVEHDFQNLGRRSMVLNARRVDLSDGRGELILLAIEDRTDDKRVGGG